MNEPINYEEHLLTPEEVSKWLNVSLSTIYKWSHTGYVPMVKLGGSIRFVRGEIVRWLKRRSRRGRDTHRLDVNGFFQKIR